MEALILGVGTIVVVVLAYQIRKLKKEIVRFDLDFSEQNKINKEKNI